MKLLVVFLVVMMVSSGCMGGTSPRRAMIGGIYGQEQRHDHVGKGKASEGRRNRVEDSWPAKNINNHHNIPRQKYDDWGSNSPDNGDDNGDDGSG